MPPRPTDFPPLSTDTPVRMTLSQFWGGLVGVAMILCAVFGFGFRIISKIDHMWEAMVTMDDERELWQDLADKNKMLLVPNPDRIFKANRNRK